MKIEFGGGTECGGESQGAFRCDASFAVDHFIYGRLGAANDFGEVCLGPAAGEPRAVSFGRLPVGFYAPGPRLEEERELRTNKMGLAKVLLR